MILVARHGETDDNASPARVQGWRDVPLNERGRAQARALAERVGALGLRALWTSPLARAHETAEIVGAAVGLEARSDDRLRESRRGSWEGRLIEDIERDDAERWTAWRRSPADFRFPGGGESIAEHGARVAAALEDVAAGPLPALVVCHGGTIRCAFALAGPRGLAAYHDVEVPNAEPLRLP